MTGELKALITGLAGPVLTAEERRFLQQSRPCGIILFARNCVDAPQIRTLVAQAREAIGPDDILVLIDQEGGRVQRLRPPLARALPSAANFGALYASHPAQACEAAFAVARLVGEDLRGFGINTNCAPVADLPVPGSHDIIGDRAYGATVEQVAALADAVARGFMAAGVVPVVKHIPGHGRATADSHLDLPIVTTPRSELSLTDFATFRRLAHLPTAMTAHVVFSALDPSAPATTSPGVIGDIIRGEIGFDGLLMSDDLSMKALNGCIVDRARASIAAGCDVALHCNGDLTEMTDAAAGVPALTGKAKARFETAIRITRTVAPFDERNALDSLALAWAQSPQTRESV